MEGWVGGKGRWVGGGVNNLLCARLFCCCAWAVSLYPTGLLSFAPCFVVVFTLWMPTFLVCALMSGAALQVERS